MNTCNKRFEVTTDAVRSATDIYRLAEIQHVRLRRPLLSLALGVGTGVLGFTAVFWPELYPAERLTIAATVTVVIAIASRIARLDLNALALRDGDGVLWGETGEMRRLKTEIEQALSARAVRHRLSIPPIPAPAKKE